MVVTKCNDCDYKFMVYAGKFSTTLDSMWLDVAHQFAMTDAFNSFGTLVSIRRDEEKLSLRYDAEDCTSNLIEVSIASMEALASGEIIEVYVW